MSAPKVGDKFSFGKGGYVYTVIRMKDDVALIEADNGIRGRICVSDFLPDNEGKGSSAT